MTTLIYRIIFFSILLQFAAFFQLQPPDANATTDYFIFPGGDAKSIYCGELEIKDSRIQCITNTILMEFDQKEINMIEVIHNGQSLKISHVDENTMAQIKNLVSSAPGPSDRKKAVVLATKLQDLPFAEKAAAFRKKLSLGTTFGQTATAFLLLGMTGIVTGSLMYAVAAFRSSILWGLGCIFIPIVPVIFLFSHWEAARKPFHIIIFSLVATSAALFLINMDGLSFNINKDTGQNSFQCRGKIYCSEMISCAEAKYYLRNCPGTKIDGDHDGIPCERQWCN